ncbi:MAG: hypothetical protein ACYC6F_08340 [Longimicrobiales bacterium]
MFILEARDWFAGCRHLYDPRTDLILTYDFALKREVENKGGAAFFVDHLVDRDIMQENNFRVYEFFRNWHLDRTGADLFSYKDVPFGFSFRLEYWNDYVFYVRVRVCIERLREVKYDSIFVGTDLGLVESILDDMGLGFQSVHPPVSTTQTSYYFPIHRWMRENMRRSGLKANVINWCAWTLGTALSWIDRIRGEHEKRPTVFAQEYHPTRDLIRRLKEDGKVRVVVADVSRTQLWSRYIPLWSVGGRLERTAGTLLENFRAKRVARLVLGDGLDLTEIAYGIIERRISPRLANSLGALAAIMAYFERNPVGIELLVANIGGITPLVDCVCRAHGVPSYLIVNGLLGSAFVDDAKHATVINSYSVTVRDHYFRGMTNVVCLGDPRMDQYPPTERRRVDPDAFTVGIGASGHSNVDLNSYVAVEFDFLDQVLQALNRVKQQGVELRVVVKVRGNGYAEQYRRFVDEYFSGLAVEVLDHVPMAAVFEMTDLWISIFSQTLFEASCLGIPSLYYRADNQILDPPFDGQSELVTVGCVEDLVQAVNDFRDGHPRYDAFLQRAVMEKYVGPLDGRNLDRNCEHLYGMLSARGAMTGS